MARNKNSRKRKKKTKSISSQVGPFDMGNVRAISEQKQIQAANFIDEAYDSRGAKRAELIKQALEIDPDHVLAYRLMGDDADDIKSACEWYEKGVQAGWRIYRRDNWKEHGDALWYLHEARSFLRCMCVLADTYWRCGNQEKAFATFEKYLSLCAFDNVGARFDFLSYYFIAHSFPELEILLDKFKDDVSAPFCYSQALYSFATEGVCPKTQAFLAEALDYNLWVAKILLGATSMPKTMPARYSLQSKEEAAIYCGSGIAAWRAIPGALEWLSKQSGIKAPCPSGKEKGVFGQLPKNLASVIDSEETLALWVTLYHMAYSFASVRPWEFIPEERPFAVQNPYTGQVSICVITGAIGDSRALNVFFREMDWDKVMKATVSADRYLLAEVYAGMDCLVLEFAPWAELDVMDKRLIKVLPGEWSKIKLYPKFRSLRPSFISYFLDYLEAKFATAALAVACAFVELPESKQFNDEGIAAFELTKEIVKDMAKDKGQWQQLRNVFPSGSAISDFTAKALSQTSKYPRNEQAAWEVDWISHLKGFYDERFVRPLAIQTVIVADRDSHFVIKLDIIEPNGSLIEQVAQTLRGAIIEVGYRPRVLYMRKKELLDCLTPIMAQLGVRITEAKKLFAVADFQDEMAKNN